MKKRKFALEAYILICFAVFYFMYRHDPALKTSTLIDCGAPVGFKLVEGELWRFPLSMFLHSSWDHLIGNCFWLYVLGRKVEAYYGSGRFILITLGIGLITNGAFLFEMVPQAGASGVLYGYFAFHLYLFFFDREHFSRSNAVIILLFLANLLYEILYPYLFPVVIDPFKESPKLIIKGHVFGFLGGLGIYLFLNKDKVKHIYKSILVSLLIVLILSLGVKISQYNGSEEYYLTMVPYLAEKKLPAKANYYYREYLNKYIRNLD